MSHTSNHYLESAQHVADRIAKINAHMLEFCRKRGITVDQLHDQLMYYVTDENRDSVMTEIAEAYRKEFGG